MALILSPSDTATRTLDQNGKSVSPANGSEHLNGHEAKWTWSHTTQTLAVDARQTGSRSSILPVEKNLCVTPGQSTNGQEAIARLDAADMACLCRDEDEAMTRLMRRHAQRLHSVIARMLKDWNEATDVVDEAFIRVYRHRHRFDLQARFTTWLYTIAFNLARNRFRHRARQPEIISLEELDEEELESQQRVTAREPAPDVRLEHEEEMRGMEDSLAALPPQLREPVRLFAYDELSQIEIGSLLHCSAKAVESRLYHARKQLRADFERFLHPRISVGPFKPQHKIEIKT
jgi:RNA polymerase sigma factor (sigma-70 family)